MTSSAQRMNVRTNADHIHYSRQEPQSRVHQAPRTSHNIEEGDGEEEGQVTGQYRSIERGHSHPPQGSTDDLEGMGWGEEEETEDTQDASPPADRSTMTAAERNQLRQELSREVNRMKRDLRQTIESNTHLDRATQTALIQEYTGKADAVLSERDPNRAQEKLDRLPQDLEEAITSSLDTHVQTVQREKEELLPLLMRLSEAPHFQEDRMGYQGWKRTEALTAAEHFKTAIGPGGNWAQFRSDLNALQGSEGAYPVQRLVTAIYRIAGNDEEKAIKMINYFVPQEDVQLMADKVIQNGVSVNDPNQVGPDKIYEWTPSGTADFLRRCQQARSDSGLESENQRPSGH